MGKKKNSTDSLVSRDVSLVNGIISGERRGIFEQGYDKLIRPYQKKLDDNGIYTK